MNRPSIRLTHKIMAIGAVGLAGLLAFGAIYQIGSSSQEASRAVADRARAISDLNKQLSIELLEARRNEKNFQQRREESYARDHAGVVVMINRDFDQLQAVVQSAGLSSLSEKIRLAHDGFNSYANVFSALVRDEVKLGMNETLGLSGSLRAAVHDIESRLNEVDDPRLTSGMLMMRRHEKDFMLRRDQKYVGELKKAVTAFSKMLAAAAIPPAQMAELTAKLEKYQNEFLAWANTAQEVAGYDASMMKTFRAIEPLTVEVGQGVRRLYEEADAAEAEIRGSVKMWMLIALVLAVVVVSATSFLIGRSISTALSAMVRAMTGLAGGDATIAIPGLARKDEVGEMAGAVQVFKTNMVETERLRAEQSESEARQVQQRKADMHRLADAFEGAVGEIVETVSSAATELEAAARTLTTTAERSQELAGAVAAASEEASTNVQSVASASEEMSSSVNEISRQVQESSRVANDAVEQAQKTNDRVGELSKAAARIGDVVELINTIAGQTNLLALNATIEAARAGEAGRGFAVVASEVKALAEQTAKATGEISQQIGGIQAATQESVGAIREIGHTIGRMSEISSTIAAAVEQQGAATQEISRNIQHASEGTSQVSFNIADVQRGAGETGSASAQVLSSAQSLSSESNRLKLEVNRFLSTVRAA
jgi:methyl-accepting chemotaxis protein